MLPVDDEDGVGGSDSGDGRVDPRLVRVLDALSTRTPRPLDDVARRAGLAVTEVMSALGHLEAEGEAVRDARGWRRRRAG
jgi:DNA processing protein